MIRIAAAASLLAAAPLAAQTPPPAAPAAPDPARLAAGERVATLLVPDGSYLRIMRTQLPEMMDAIIGQMGSMTPGDVGGTGGGSAMDEVRRKDPAFDERMKITTRVMGEEMGALMGKLEPRVRAGLGRALARRFTAQQLADLTAFFATPSGKAFAENYLALMADPEMVREMAASTPEIMRAMPQIMTKVQEATKHLPPPPKPADSTEDPAEEKEDE
jgi:hypothetical protein